MKIIGISGLEQSPDFTKRQWPHLDEREARICQGFDAAAALVIDGEIVAAAAEERFNRRKHSGAFPLGAIRSCLDQAGLAIGDVDEIAHAFDYAPWASAYALDPVARRRYREVFSKAALLSLVRRDLPKFPETRVHQVTHHTAHAASAYLTSGWDECLVVVMDGMGEVHSTSVYHARGGVLEPLRHLSAGDSIGILYSLVTLHLGFDFNADEYKIMGLAPYGDPERFRAFFDEAVRLHTDGTFSIPILKINRTHDEREQHLATRRYLQDHLIPARHPNSPIFDAHCDVAAALQACLDRTMRHLCGRFAERAGLRRLALAGGVALNCTANGVLLHSGLFDEVYVQPAAGDDGAALGAALYRASQHHPVPNRRMPVPFLGPAFSTDNVRSALARYAPRIHAAESDTLEGTCARAADLIADGRVIAWCRGRMEFGPRALGHRSILADPGRPDMRDRINAMVKMREAFRPFAPAVSIEQAHQWFDVAPGTELPYMIVTVDVRQPFRSSLPAITHVNGSARVQTVSAHANGEFHRLLRAVGKVTGREMVLNTSFNVKGQPIVNTPHEAIATLLGTDIDALFLDNIVVTRRGTTR